MVAFKVVVYSGIASFDFRLVSPQEQDQFTGNMLKKLIKKKQQLPYEMEFGLKDEDGLEIDDIDVLARFYPEGTTLHMTVRAEKKIANEAVRASPYDGAVAISYGNWQDRSSVVYLFSPLHPCNFITGKAQDAGVRALNNKEVMYFSVPEDNSLVDHDVSYGLSYLREHVQAYFCHGDRVWFWWLDGQVDSWPLVFRLFDEDAFLKKRRRDKKKHLLKMKGLLDKYEGVEVLRVEAMDMYRDVKKEKDFLQKQVDFLKKALGNLRSRAESVVGENKDLNNSLTQMFEYINELEQSNETVEQLQKEVNTLTVSVKYLEDEKATLQMEVEAMKKKKEKKEEAKEESDI